MKLAVLPGDDIGPEIMDATLAVVREAEKKFGLTLSLEVHEVGMSVYRKRGTTLPPEVLEAARAADGVLLGPGGMTLYPPAGEGGINIPGTIRKQLDLFANIRPARSRPGVPKAHPGLDCVIVRENTEGFYADRNLFQGYGEFMPTPDCAIALRLITAKASRRIAEVAFKVARTRRKHVTVVGKRHVMQVTDGLFMGEVDKVAAQYPDVTLREIDIDAIAAELYTRPSAFDVILTTNMFGDILSNLVNALAGGLGMASALNVGDTHAAANAGHGSAPDIAGKGIANPTGLVLSAAALLRHLGLTRGAESCSSAGEAIERAVDSALANAESRTGDLGGTAGTVAAAEAICRHIRDSQK
ncbi:MULTISPECIES: isocitrate/isopropylmalate dehydrogenase family protein [Paraburkholderia]|uniref:isocitrate/isopropylmalate dehydrogenase family protein n=1 Tax=Paraburkholderia TaxID=1822464 RepID=UPI00225B2746|nr:MULTISPECIES: isocitrate/isopropylmalate dehydrogenase family protein [Paraburkholderia]MCX4163177.1 isocitrate/isopropylmalate dehydrogenase family protein [Paraburkholderia megapolitana]MDN7158673.1 isocitrate/isopropylmalate dehydrogenase family protein [Paraburkholderia sp. CHISQ3]MDQ6495720.1 isocitrate/isopropylmalate dehydrogenase family protein [Paraburkholderia megapolitana]